METKGLVPSLLHSLLVIDSLPGFTVSNRFVIGYYRWPRRHGYSATLSAVDESHLDFRPTPLGLPQNRCMCLDGSFTPAVYVQMTVCKF